jgi:uncharacterized protein
MANHLCWFEVSSTDPEKAREFYSDLFGWKTKKARANYYQMTTGRIPHGGLIKKLPLVPNTGVYVYIHVASIEKTLAKVKKLGGKLLVGKTKIPGFGYYAFLADIDGNPIGLFSEK